MTVHEIDLHSHTTFSDGTFSPEELINHAVAVDVKTLAVTDHDSTMGIDYARDAAKDKDITLIPGIEISAYNGRFDVHVLGYLPDYKEAGLMSYLERLHNVRLDRNKRMVDRLNEYGYPITLEDLLSANPSSIITRGHVAGWLVRNGYVKDKDQAFREIVGDKCPCYVPKAVIDPVEAAYEITKAGGLAFLAHPGHYYEYSEEEFRDFLGKLKEAGLAGIEICHPDHTVEDEVRFRNLAKEFDLMMSGGSDFHGLNKPKVKLGEGYGKPELPEEIYATAARLVENWTKTKN